MQFHLMNEPDVQACGEGTIATWQSDGGRFRLSLHPVLFGRCRLSLYRGIDGGSGGYDPTYCLGADDYAILTAPSLVMAALQHADEEALFGNPRAIQGLLPAQAIKPMARDLWCWRELKRMAGAMRISDDLGRVGLVCEEAAERYVIVRVPSTGRSIICRRCNLQSFAPGDVENRYCSGCGQFHLDAMAADVRERAVAAGVLQPAGPAEELRFDDDLPAGQEDT